MSQQWVFYLVAVDIFMKQRAKATNRARIYSQDCLGIWRPNPQGDWLRVANEQKSHAIQRERGDLRILEGRLRKCEAWSNLRCFICSGEPARFMVVFMANLKAQYLYLRYLAAGDFVNENAGISLGQIRNLIESIRIFKFRSRDSNCEVDCLSGSDCPVNI